MRPRPVRTLALAAVLAAACDCGEVQLKQFSENTVVILSPNDGQVIVSSEVVEFHATAHNPAGLQSLSLRIGTQDAKVCPAGEPDTDIDCTTTFRTPDFAGQIEQGQLLLTASALDTGASTRDVSIHVRIKPLRVKIKQPVPDRNSNPPLATVKGTSNLVVEVVSTLPVASVDVGLDDRTYLMRKTAPPYTQSVTWNTLGIGPHRLTARAADTDGSEDTDVLDIRVVCSADSQCPAGLRCCAADGQCYTTVARGADCDCQHPCPTDQGCFPGTCGQTPRKCRPGCFPGSEQQRMDRCTPQDSRPAYCSDLPQEESTSENRGGACAPADSCDITRQNCPDLPVDRSAPVGADNPAVKQKCVPSSPTTNVCMPAGPKGDGSTECHEGCASDATRSACKAGFLCVTTIDATTHQPLGPAKCRQLCPEPGDGFFPSRSTCPSGQYCTGLLGPGYEEYATGACQDPLHP